VDTSKIIQKLFKDVFEDNLVPIFGALLQPFTFKSLGYTSQKIGIMILQIVELPGHPYYVGVQFHPEFKSRPGKPSAVFLGELEIHFWVLYNCAID